MAAAYPDSKDIKIVDMDKEGDGMNGKLMDSGDHSKDSEKKMKAEIVEKNEENRQNWRKGAVKLESQVSKDVFADSDDEEDSESPIPEATDSEEEKKAQEHLKIMNIEFMDEIFKVAATFQSTKDRIEMIKELGDKYYEDVKVRHAPQVLCFPATPFTGEVVSRHVQKTYIDPMPLFNVVEFKKRKGGTIDCNSSKIPKTDE
ncbi:hypothetical protein CRE_23032 [Caenorhabditis remanei]|uniref:Uncharacterized protein n=1 Tax=Caenorhabditis remanei TaxID=31234 RepID=E3N4G4_CAERE|nr:hypothetical protein CRE_23032 [Caenorhabditis remanei]